MMIMNSTKDDRITLKRRGGDDGYKNFSIRIKAETVNQLDKLSQASNISRNELIGILLDFAIPRCDIE